MMADRCVACNDPTPSGWMFCRTCHAWNDLAVAIEHPEIGMDSFRMRRWQRYVARSQPRESVRSLLAKLMRRVEELEHVA